MGYPIVFIHGMWCTGANFNRLIDGLRPRGYDCHAPNLPGHEVGVAHPEVGAKSISEYLDFMEDYVHRQNFSQPPIILGHSMGGLLAQQLATRIKPLALVLLTPAPPAGINALKWKSMVAFARTLTRWGFWRRPHKPTIGRARASVFNGLAPEKQDALYRGMVEESGRAAFEIGFWWADLKGASRLDASKITCPVYVVSAGQDCLTPAAVVRKVAALYPNASHRHWPQRSHWVIDDGDTDEMIVEIAGWLRPFEQRASRGQPPPR